MKKIESYNQFKSLIDSNTDKHETNLFMYPDEISNYIGSGMFFYDDSQIIDALQFYIEFDDYYKLYLNTGMTGKLLISPKDKPIVADIIYIEKKGEPAIAGILRKSSFEHLALYKQYSVNYADLSLPESEFGEYRIDFATEDQIPDIISILNDTFSSISNELPDVITLKRRIEEKSVLCLISPEGDVCGCSQWQRNGESCLIKHTSLIPALRGRGFGKKFYIEVFRNANAKNYKCWVVEDNVVKQQMDAKLGYKPNGKHMLKLILHHGK